MRRSTALLVSLALAPTSASAWDTPIRWIAAGSGSIPADNQVSIEQDMALAERTFGPGGVLLYSGGPGSHGVQVDAGNTAASSTDRLLARLGGLFDPRGGRSARYRKTVLSPAGPATAEGVGAAIQRALDQKGSSPLTVYLAGHGQVGQAARDNTVALWEQSSLSVADLAELLDASTGGRPVRVVVTSCYSGGFAELAFTDANPEHGAPGSPRCGFFATTWDLQASGCDPNPDRRTQEGYGMHFLNALQARDRDGRTLPLRTLDLDGDGTISMLEAHTRARVASEAMDVPTTTSERWLRATAPESGPSRAPKLPEEDAVVAALARRLGMTGREDDARARLDTLERKAEALRAEVDDEAKAEHAAYRQAAAELLARWPVLDDPWHPAFGQALATHRKAIGKHLDRSKAYARYLAARRRADTLDAQIFAARRQSAPYERLVRALDTRILAGRLQARGGADWATYESFLACERTRP